MTNKHKIKPIDELIKQFTDNLPVEPPEKAVALYAASYAKMFDTIRYRRDGIVHFDRILDFMARYHLATGVKMNIGDEADAIYEAELKGKTFVMPKGLLLRGLPGTGKTFAARVISEHFGIPMWDTYQIGMYYFQKDGQDWLHDLILHNSRQAIIIDDIGAEGELKKYGNESPMGMIFTMRAKYWEQHGTPTIYTTNIEKTRDLVNQCYGGDVRLLDRLTAYQVGVEFTGASKRQ
jgi:hypothetical protein